MSNKNNNIYNSKLYQKEVEDLKRLIKSFQDNYDSLCHYLENNISFSDSKKPLIKKKKVDRFIDYTLVFYLMQLDDSILKIYNENIRDKDKVEVYYIHMLYKRIINFLYDTLNLIHLSHSYKNNKSINPLINLYLEERKNLNTQTHFFESLYSSSKLIKNDSIKNICIDMIDDFYRQKERIFEYEKKISENYRRLELFLRKQRREIVDINDLEWFNDFLESCCNNIGNRDKQKRID